MICTEFIKSYLWSEHFPFAKGTPWWIIFTVLLNWAYRVQASTRQHYWVLQAAAKFKEQQFYADRQFWIFISTLAPKNFTSLLASPPPTLFSFFFFFLTKLGTLGRYMERILQLPVRDKFPLEDRVISSPDGNNPLVIMWPSDICHVSRMTKIFLKLCS